VDSGLADVQRRRNVALRAARLCCCSNRAQSAQQRPTSEPATEIGGWPDWPWALMDYLPSVTQATNGYPALVIWHFQLPAA